jgi:[ribosomal protein S5]-alanine N-acetyltransferase
MLSIDTQRLRLIAATIEHGEAEVHKSGQLSKLLGAQIPETWPPPLNDDASMLWFLRYLQENPDAHGWTMWYFVLRNGPGGMPKVIGSGGFKGKPSTDGTVEMGYSIMENHQRQGYCTEAMRALVDWAFEHNDVNRVVAETMLDLTPSIRVMEKVGLAFVGKGAEEGTIRYELPRWNYETQQSLKPQISRSVNPS